MIKCARTFRPAMGDCQADLSSCLDSCNPPPQGPPPPPRNCLGSCGQDLAACSRDVVSQARSCLAGCRTATDRVACLAGCADAAKQGGASCSSDFQLCR